MIANDTKPPEAKTPVETDAALEDEETLELPRPREADERGGEVVHEEFVEVFLGRWSAP